MATSVGEIEATIRLRDELSGQLRQVESNLRRMGVATTQAGTNAAQTAQKFRVASSIMVDAGAVLTAGVTLPIIGLAAASVKTAIQFESAFAGVKKTVEGVADSTGALTVAGDALQRGLRDMTKEIPLTANELAKIAQIGGQLNVQTPDILKFTETIARLGTAIESMTVEEAAQGLGNLASVTGEAHANFDRMGSTLALMGDTAAATEKDILAFAIRMGATGKAAGLSTADILGLATAMADVGVNAEAGGTSMNKVFKALLEASREGTEGMADFAKVAGQSVEVFSRKFKTDAAGAVVDFINGLRRIHSEGGNMFKTLEDLGLADERLQTTMVSLTASAGKLAGTVRSANEEWVRNTKLTRESELRYQTTAAQVQILWNRFEDLLRVVGNMLLPTIKTLIGFLDNLIGVLETMTGFVEGLPTPLRAVAQAIIGVTAALGPLLLLLGVRGLIAAGGNATKALSDLVIVGLNPMVAKAGVAAGASSGLIQHLGALVGLAKTGAAPVATLGTTVATLGTAAATAATQGVAAGAGIRVLADATGLAGSAAKTALGQQLALNFEVGATAAVASKAGQQLLPLSGVITQTGAAAVTSGAKVGLLRGIFGGLGAIIKTATLALVGFVGWPGTIAIALGALALSFPKVRAAAWALLQVLGEMAGAAWTHLKKSLGEMATLLSVGLKVAWGHLTEAVKAALTKTGEFLNFLIANTPALSTFKDFVLGLAAAYDESVAAVDRATAAMVRWQQQRDKAGMAPPLPGLAGLTPEEWAKTQREGRASVALGAGPLKITTPGSPALQAALASKQAADAAKAAAATEVSANEQMIASLKRLRAARAETAAGVRALSDVQRGIITELKEIGEVGTEEELEAVAEQARTTVPIVKAFLDTLSGGKTASNEFGESVAELSKELAGLQRAGVGPTEIVERMGEAVLEAEFAGRTLDRTLPAALQRVADAAKKVELTSLVQEIQRVNDAVDKLEGGEREAIDQLAAEMTGAVTAWGYAGGQLSAAATKLGGAAAVSKDWLMQNAEAILSLAEGAGKADPVIQVLAARISALTIAERKRAATMAENAAAVQATITWNEKLVDALWMVAEAQAELSRLGRTTAQQQIAAAETAVAGRVAAIRREFAEYAALYNNLPVLQQIVEAEKYRVIKAASDQRIRIAQVESDIQLAETLNVSQEIIASWGNMARDIEAAYATATSEMSEDGRQLSENEKKHIAVLQEAFDKARKSVLGLHGDVKTLVEALELKEDEWRKIYSIMRSVASVMRDMGHTGLADYIDRVTAALELAGKAMIELQAGFKQLSGGDTLTGLANLASGIAGVYSAMKQATDTGSKLGNVLGGAATGAKIGGSILPGWGHAIGAVAGGLFGLFGGGKSKEEKADEEADVEIKKLVDELLAAQGGFEALEAEANALGLTIHQMLGVKGVKGLKALKEAAAEFEKQQKRLNDALERYGLSWRDLGGAIKQVRFDKLADEILASAQVMTTAMVDPDKMVRAMADDLNSLIRDALTAGVQIPAGLQPILVKLIEMGLLTEENRRAMLGLSEVGATSWETIREVAEKYGIELDRLGPKVQQLQMDAEAKAIYDDWQLLLGAGAEINAVMQGMSDEVQVLIDRALKFGIVMPENMRPMLELMTEGGLLTDEMGETLKDLTRIQFAEPLSASVDRLLTKLDELIAAIKEGVGGALDDLGKKVVRPTIKPTYDPSEGPPTGGAWPNPPEFERGTHGRYFDFGPGTVALLHGRERIMTYGEGEGGPASQPVQITVPLYLDGREVARSVVRYTPDVLRDAGAW